MLAEIVAGETPEARRANALATLSAMMGAVILARAMDDPVMADEFLAATHRAAVSPARLGLLCRSIAEGEQGG